MAERRLLALLGPCRVDGVGGGVGYEDLRGLDGVDVQALHEDVSSRALTTALELVRDEMRRASRAANDAAWAPLGLHAPEPKFACCSWWPELVLPSVEVSEPETGSRAGAKRRAEFRAEEEKDENAPPPSRRESAAPDSRWLGARCADEALAEMVASASRSTSAQLEDDALDSMTNPAGAAARAAALLARGADAETNERSETNVAWITAGVDGGGGGGGEWPPEAVAAYGVMRAAKQAGGEATIVVLVADEGQNAETRRAENETETETETENVAPPLLLEIAARVGAAIRTVRFASSEGARPTSDGSPNGSPGVFGDSCRWRGGLTVAAAPETTLPGLRLRGAFDADAGAAPPPETRGAPVSTKLPRHFPRAAGDATLLEIVRLETVPADRRRDAPALRLEWTPAPIRGAKKKNAETETEPKTETETAATRLGALRDDVFAALAAASRVAATRGETPAFLVRVPFVHVSRRTHVIANAYDTKARTVSAPAPHADGPILLVRLDFLQDSKKTTFVAEALASLPSLLARAVAVAGASAAFERARAAAARDAKPRLAEARPLQAEARGADGGGTEKAPAATTPASVASTGRKRARAGEKTRAAAAAAAAKRRSSERRRDKSASVAATTRMRAETEASEDADLSDDASRERALAGLASARVRALAGVVVASRRRVAAETFETLSRETFPPTIEETLETLDAPPCGTGYGEARGASGASARRRPLEAPAFARVLSALAAAQRRRDGFPAEAGDGASPLLPASEGWAPEKLRLTAALLRAAADVAAGRDVVAEARRDAASGPGASDPETRSRGEGPEPSSLAGARSRSPSKSGASFRELGSKAAAAPARPGGDAAPPAPGASAPALSGPGGLDYAAAEAELRAKVQRERREKRERQRMTMAPRHVPAARRTGNAVLAAATAFSDAKASRGVALQSRGQSRAGALHGPGDRANGSGGGTASGPDRSGEEREKLRSERGARDGAGVREPEPSESAVGAGAAGPGPAAPRNRVCTKCHIELAPIPGVNMSLMKHCYACGGTLAPGM